MAAFFIALFPALEGIAVTWANASPVTASTPSTSREVLRLFGKKKIKVRGKLKVMRFEDIDRHLANILAWAAANGLETRESATGAQMELRFSEIFQPVKDTAYFPLTNSVVKLVPESSLSTVRVFDPTGVALGTFSNKYPYTHTGSRTFTLFYFQYLTPEGQLRRSGTDLLLDRFLAPWPEIRDRPLLFLGPGM